VVGHSGAFRTILPWLVHKRVRQIILLDGLYGGEDEFAAWLRTGKGRRRLVLISVETRERAKRLTGRFSASVDLARVPDSLAELSRRDRRAALIHIQGIWDHMELVTGGQVLPALLRLTPLKRTGQAPDD